MPKRLLQCSILFGLACTINPIQAADGKPVMLSSHLHYSNTPFSGNNIDYHDIYRASAPGSLPLTSECAPFSTKKSDLLVRASDTQSRHNTQNRPEDYVYQISADIATDSNGINWDITGGDTIDTYNHVTQWMTRSSKKGERNAGDDCLSVGEWKTGISNTPVHLTSRGVAYKPGTLDIPYTIINTGNGKKWKTGFLHLLVDASTNSCTMVPDSGYLDFGNIKPEQAFPGQGDLVKKELHIALQCQGQTLGTLTADGTVSKADPSSRDVFFGVESLSVWIGVTTTKGGTYTGIADGWTNDETDDSKTNLYLAFNLHNYSEHTPKAGHYQGTVKIIFTPD